MDWSVLLLTLGLMGLATAGLAIRVILVKGAEFRGTCASNNPMLRDELGIEGSCPTCGASADEKCKSEDQ